MWMKLAWPLYFWYRGSMTVSITGPQVRLSQKAGVAKATTAGLPEAMAWAMVTSCMWGRGGNDESISVMSATSERMSWRLGGAGSPAAGSGLLSRTPNWNRMGFIFLLS